MQGVIAAATGAIAGTVLVLDKHSIRDLWTVAIAVITFLVLMKLKIPELIIILASGTVGILIHL